MLKIRLARGGRKNHPIYRVIISDHTKTPTAKALEVLGSYNPHTDPSTFEVKEDRIKYWLENGAQYSDTVGGLLAKKGIIEKVSTKYTSNNPKKSKKAKAAAKTATEDAEKAAKEKKKEEPKKEEKK